MTASVTVSHMHLPMMKKYEGTVQNSALGEGTSIYVKTAKCIGGPAAGRIMRRLSTTAKLACCLA